MNLLEFFFNGGHRFVSTYNPSLFTSHAWFTYFIKVGVGDLGCFYWPFVLRFDSGIGIGGVVIDRIGAVKGFF